MTQIFKGKDRKRKLEKLFIYPLCLGRTTLRGFPNLNTLVMVNPKLRGTALPDSLRILKIYNMKHWFSNVTFLIG